MYHDPAGNGPVTARSAKVKIAVLEDETAVLDTLRDVLEEAGYDCVTFEHSHQLVRTLHHERFDLFVLDWNMPDLTGLRVLEWIRNQIGDMPPVLILTGRLTDEDLVTGLKAGADDYIVKPINPPILLARIEALLRRSHMIGAERIAGAHGPYEFDASARRIWLRGAPIEITPKEFQLATHLFRNVNVAVSRSYLLETIWGFAASTSTRTLDIHMSNLRRKLKLAPENGFILAPVYGYGYRLEEIASP